MRWPATRSGKVTVREITDQEALALQSQDILLVYTPYGLAPLEVESIKFGVAGESGEAFDVPVIVGHIVGHKTLSYAVPDCLIFEFE